MNKDIDTLKSIQRLNQLATRLICSVDNNELEGESNYLQKIVELKAVGWSYVLGKEYEINPMPDWYLSQRQDVLDDLEGELIDNKGEMIETERDSESNLLALQKYRDNFADMTWVNGGIYILDCFSELPNEDMPRAYMNTWWHLSNSKVKDLMKDLNNIQEPFSEGKSECTESLQDEYNEKLNQLLDTDWDYAFNKDMELPEEYMLPRYLEHKAKIVKRLEEQLRESAQQYSKADGHFKKEHEAIMAYYDIFIELLCINGGIRGLVIDEHLPMEKMPKVYQYHCRVMAA